MSVSLRRRLIDLPPDVARLCEADTIDAVDGRTPRARGLAVLSAAKATGRRCLVLLLPYAVTSADEEAGLERKLEAQAQDTGLGAHLIDLARPNRAVEAVALWDGRARTDSTRRRERPQAKITLSPEVLSWVDDGARRAGLTRSDHVEAILVAQRAREARNR